MRSAVRKRRLEGDEESVFVSMTDMTVSFLFIVMILLAFFASQFRPDEMVAKVELDEVLRRLEASQVELAKRDEKIDFLQRQILLLEAHEKNAVEEYAKAADAARLRIITELKGKIQEAIPEVEVTISNSGDILRFRGDSFFAFGDDRILEPRILAVVRALAEGLEELLPCFTLGDHSRWHTQCNPDAVLVDAVQIEGHTDSVGSAARNLRLSLRRGAATYLEVEGHRPLLLEYQNLKRESVLSVSGYGETRPVESNETASGRGSNRRIDLRLIMASVRDVNEIVKIRQQLDDRANSAWQEGSER